MSQWDAFKEAVRDAADIVRVVGDEVELRRSGRTLKGCSPFTGEKHPSFHVWPERQSWWDFSGGRNTGGDVFAYVMERHGYSFNEALTFLADKFGVQRPHITEEEGARLLAIEEERRQVQHVHDLAAEYYHRVLPEEIRDRHFRQHYGFTDETIDRFRLGWATGRLWEYLTEVRDVPRPTALKSGLFVQLEDGRIVDFFQKRLVFPYWKRGRVCYFTARQTDQTPDKPWERDSKYKKLLTRSEKFPYVSELVVNDTFLNEDSVRAAELVVLTEGTPDCISGAQAGFACISPGTTTFREQDLEKLIALTAKAKRVVICNDSEAKGSGDKGAMATAKALWAGGRPVYVASIPRPDGRDKIDLNELAKEQGDQAVGEVIASARWFPQVLIEQVPKDKDAPSFQAHVDEVLAAAASANQIDRERIVSALSAWIDVGKRPLKEMLKAVARRRPSTKQGDDPSVPQRDGFPVIVVNRRPVRELLDEMNQVVIAANGHRMKAAAAGVDERLTPMFRRGGTQLVRLVRDSQHRVSLGAMNLDLVQSFLSRCADWVSVKVSEHGIDTEQTKPPDHVTADLLVLPPPELPPIVEVLSTPVFGKGGELLLNAGYHDEDQVWLSITPGLDVPPVPERPDATDVERAKSRFFEDLFVDFPFATLADRAHALAAVLALFVRRMIPGGIPLHLVEAPVQGSGKTKLVKLVDYIVRGTSSVGPLPEGEEEMRKRVTAELLDAPPLVLFDNVPDSRTIDSPTLALLLTGEEWRERRLGTADTVTLPNRTVWFMTGNNPQLAPDLVRRVLRIRLAPDEETPSRGRTFKHADIEAWAREHRGELVHAALVLIQAWIAAGQPKGKEKLESFDDWARTVGGILEVVGVPGFLGNVEETFLLNEGRAGLCRELVGRWWALHRENPLRSTDVVQLCVVHDELGALLGKADTPRGKEVKAGRLLQGLRDRVFDGYRITFTGLDRKGSKLYALKPARPGHEQVALPIERAAPAASIEPF